MARTAASPEAKILTWFRTAPSAVAWLVFGLVKDVLRERRTYVPAAERVAAGTRSAAPPPQAHPQPPRKHPMSQAQREHLRKKAKARWAKIRKAQAQPAQEKNWTSPHARAGKGNPGKAVPARKHRKPQAGAVASGVGNGAEAEVESFDPHG